MSVTKRQHNQTGYVEIDHPPVNAIGVAARQGLLEAVYWAESNKLERVIVSGAGKTFAAGGDAREFDTEPEPPHLPDVLNAIENSFVPWIAAINGIALGGGAEIALACCLRVIKPNAQIGFPEVHLGVVPGAGGTQRLPRLVGLQKSLDMIVTGKAVDAEFALAAGIVDLIDDNPVDAAFMINAEQLHDKVAVSTLPNPVTDTEALSTYRKQTLKKMAGQVAPRRAIDLVEAACTMDFTEASKLEREAFLELRKSAQAKALRHLFFAERAARNRKRVAPGLVSGGRIDSDQIAIVGGGTMGTGIAYAAVNSGLRVCIIETDNNAIERTTQNIEHILTTSEQRGLISNEQAQARRAQLTLSTDYGQVKNAALAIEAVFEDINVKLDVLKQLEHTLTPAAVIATNTSYLNIESLANDLSDPTRFLGLHFFAPAYIMKLLEIVRANKTSDNTLDYGFSFAKKLRKVPVIAGVCDGFIGNRILARYREVADAVLIDGATPHEIDQAMVEFGYAMGPYAAQDLSGLDIAYANRRRQDSTRDPARRYVAIADRLVEQGKLGRKTNAGWYRYSEQGTKTVDEDVTQIILQEAKVAGIIRESYSFATISQRLILAMVNEAANILDEGIADSASDIDLVTVFGYGFPRWRGGLMHHGDSIGVNKIVQQLTELHDQDPVNWVVSPLLMRCYNSGTSLAAASQQQ